jgi:hypothetical protein
VSHSPEWLDGLCRGGSFRDASRLYRMADGRRVVLPMVRRWPREGSFPDSCGMGGLVGEGAADPAVIGAVLRDVARRAALATTILPNPLDADSWAAARPPGVLAVPRCDYVLDLRAGLDAVVKGFDSDARRGLRKAATKGVEVECGRSGALLREFFDLFDRSLRRWAQQQHEPLALARWRARRRDPLQRFVGVANSLGEAFQVWLARVAGRPAAALVVLQGNNTEHARAAMDKELAGPSGANFLLHRLAIEEAIRWGARFYHMGLTRPDSPLAEFKSHFGAQPFHYAEYRIERLPITRIDRSLRGLVKRAIGFKDA